MTSSTATIKKLSLILAFALAIFPTAFASELTDQPNASDSIYQYNALENKNSFLTLANTEEPQNEITPEISDPINDNLEKFQSITEKQNYSIAQAEAAMDALKNRNGLKTLMIGNHVGILRFQLVQIRDEIILLDNLSKDSTSETDKIQIDSQIKLLRDEQTKVENFVSEHGNKFSLFGWFINVL